jgi:hypothetical protein
MRIFAAVLAFATSALAYQVTAPTNATGFVNNGQNTVSWNKVSTDAANFTIVLVNKNIFPNYEQVLAALVVGSLGTTQVNPPSTGWPSGSGFQINLVQDSQHLDTLLAQSDDFSFHDPPKSSSASGSQSTTALVITPSAPITPVVTPSNTPSSSQSDDGSNLNPSTTNSTNTPANSNAASPATGMSAAFFGIVALAGALLA